MSSLKVVVYNSSMTVHVIVKGHGVPASRPPEDFTQYTAAIDLPIQPITWDQLNPPAPDEAEKHDAPSEHHDSALRARAPRGLAARATLLSRDSV